MAEGTFILTELRIDGDPSTADDGDRFEWTADARSPTPFNGNAGGGARACPLKPWTLGGEQRTVRTDYPNARIPSEQVLGPRKMPHSFRGRFDDRYNGSGYALFEMRRLEAMFERGSMVRIQYGPLAFEGIPSNWKFDVQRLWDIDYEFQVSIHNRADESDRERVPTTPPSVTVLLDRLDVAVQAMLDADSLAPRHTLAGSLADDVTSELVDSVNVRERLASTIDQRDVAPPESPIDAFTHIATQFRNARASSYNLLLRLAAVRSDLDMSVQTAMGVLDFEDWTRSLRFAARIAMGSALQGDRFATERSEPDAVRLYRPQQGEHLYNIARKFYGTAHAWHLIYDRNSLRSFKMDGTERLIIPERGGT